jgi:hypothetical protein
VPRVDAKLHLFDKNRRPAGTAGGMVYLSTVLGFNQADTGEVQMLVDDSANQRMAKPGARWVLEHGGRLRSGRIIQPKWDISPAGLVTYQLRGDWSLLDETQAWVVPENPISPRQLGEIAQAVQVGIPVPNTVAGQSGYFAWNPELTTAEAALKDIIGRNFARLGRPVHIRDDQGRGGDPRGYLPEVRFGTLADAIRPILEASGLGVRIWQELAGGPLQLDVWEPRTHRRKLTFKSGALAGGTAGLGYPDFTRLVLMGAGDLAARAFDVIANEDLEAEIGHVIEGSHDSTGGDMKWPEGVPDEEQIPAWYRNRTDVDAAAYQRYLDSEGEKALAEAAAKNELELTLTESPSFSFAEGGYDVGDFLGITAGGLPWQDRVTTVSLSRASNGAGSIKPALANQPPAAADPALFRAYVRIRQLEKQQRTRAGR